MSADAAWCGQCYTPLAAASAATAPSASSVASRSTRDDVLAPPSAEPFWPCPVCGTRNPIDADLCQTCGTSFAQVMRADAERPDVLPKDALIRSLLVPGLGHRKVGRPMDGLARAVLFGVTAGMAVVLAAAGLRTAVAFAAFALFFVAAFGIYALTAYEAYRLAGGASPFLSSRQLLWAFAAVICASVALITIAVVSGSRQ